MKEFTTPNGNRFIVLGPSEFSPRSNYDATVAQTQLLDFGFIIVDVNYGQPIDNEYDIQECLDTLKLGGYI